MKWDTIDLRCKEVFERNTIIIKTPLERKVYIKILSEELPEIPRVRIIAVVDSALKRVSLPINRKTFLTTLHYSLR